MTVGEVILLFVEASGRYDLVDTEDEPTALALHMANVANQLLDSLFEYPKAPRWISKQLASGGTEIAFSQPRLVGQVTHNGVEVAWTPVGEDDPTWPHRVITVAATETDRTLRVLTKWYAPVIFTDEDGQSYWTLAAPDLLVKAMQYGAEVDMRNSQGQNDFMGPMQLTLTKMYHDLVAEDMAGPPDDWRIGVY